MTFNDNTNNNHYNSTNYDSFGVGAEAAFSSSSSSEMSTVTEATSLVSSFASSGSDDDDDGDDPSSLGIINKRTMRRLLLLEEGEKISPRVLGIVLLSWCVFVFYIYTITVERQRNIDHHHHLLLQSNNNNGSSSNSSVLGYYNNYSKSEDDDDDSDVFILWGSTHNNSNNNNNNNNNNKNDNQSTTATRGFPKDFVWGSGTSSYQIEGAVHEGGRGPTIWDSFCHDENHPDHVWNHDTGDIACDHYHAFRDDIRRIMKQGLGLKAYRFSIAWSRILPNGEGKVNQEGIDFYNQVIDLLLQNDIEPWVTLFHWDLPQHLEDRCGGWLGTPIISNDDQSIDRYDGSVILKAYEDYARLCFRLFGDRVKHWITINEPWTYSINGYLTGIHAPGHNNINQPYVVGHHLLLGHARATRIYKNEFAETQMGRIGISNSGDYKYPASASDVGAQRRALLFQMGWFTDPLYFGGEYPKEMRDRLGRRLPRFTPGEKKLFRDYPPDFVGLNYYSSQSVSDTRQPFGGYWGNDMDIHFSNAEQWQRNEMGWNIVPRGCTDMLLWISKRYDYPIIYVTENGSAENDDKSDYYYDGVYEDGEEDERKIIIRDEKRTKYFRDHIAACYEAILLGGVQLRGYFAWSVMDNFEWQFGYQRRFGLYYVDFTNNDRPRIPKQSALWYRDTIQQHGRNIIQYYYQQQQQQPEQNDN